MIFEGISRSITSLQLIVYHTITLIEEYAQQASFWADILASASQHLPQTDTAKPVQYEAAGRRGKPTSL